MGPAQARERLTHQAPRDGLRNPRPDPRRDDASDVLGAGLGVGSNLPVGIDQRTFSTLLCALAAGPACDLVWVRIAGPLVTRALQPACGRVRARGHGPDSAGPRAPRRADPLHPSRPT